jgi:hypothetical protein
MGIRSSWILVVLYLFYHYLSLWRIKVVYIAGFNERLKNYYTVVPISKKALESHECIKLVCVWCLDLASQRLSASVQTSAAQRLSSVPVTYKTSATSNLSSVSVNVKTSTTNRVLSAVSVPVKTNVNVPKNVGNRTKCTNIVKPPTIATSSSLGKKMYSMDEIERKRQEALQKRRSKALVNSNRWSSVAFQPNALSLNCQFSCAVFAIISKTPDNLIFLTRTHELKVATVSSFSSSPQLSNCNGKERILRSFCTYLTMQWEQL